MLSCASYGKDLHFSNFGTGHGATDHRPQTGLPRVPLRRHRELERPQERSRFAKIIRIILAITTGNNNRC